MTEIQHKKRILVAPLNWGLGHATRCMPIINALIAQKFQPILASDGIALALLRKEFPNLEWFELPSYDITYPKKGQYFKAKLIQSSPKLIKAIKAENEMIASKIDTFHIDGIISDNRLGVYHKQLPCVFITHQLKVLSGNTTWLSTLLHQKAIINFDECWVPDYLGKHNLSGKLSQIKNPKFPIKYIGPLSRFEKQQLPFKNDILVLLSGPEPQRTLLETQLLAELKKFEGKVVFVNGRIDDEQHISEEGHITIYNFMTSKQLQNTINESALVIARSGYTTIMDLAKLGKSAFFIPTPGQFEQEYLAQHLKELGYTSSCKQKDFNIDKLSEVNNYKGFQAINNVVNFKSLFRLFERK